MHVTVYVREGQRTICGSPFSPSTKQAPGIELRLPGLAGSALAQKGISIAILYSLSINHQHHFHL